MPKHAERILTIRSSKTRQRLPRLALTLSLFLIGCLGDQVSRGPQSTPTSTPTDTSVTTSAWTATNVVYYSPSEPEKVANGYPYLDFRILIENHAEKPITGLRWIDFQAPGFRQEKGPNGVNCWLNNAPLCVSGDPEKFIPDIQPKGSVVLGARLVPVSASGRYAVGGLLAWNDEEGRQRYSAVSLGPVQVTTHFRECLNLFAGLVKDLALPIVLLLLGTVFQFAQKRRDEKVQARQKERDIELQVWQSELPRIHSYAEEHYLGIVGSLRHLEHSYEEFEKTNWDSSKFDAMVCTPRLRQQQSGTGAVR